MESNEQIRQAICHLKRGQELTVPDTARWAYIRNLAFRTGKTLERVYVVSRTSQGICVQRTDEKPERSYRYGRAYRVLNAMLPGESRQLHERDWKKAQQARKALGKTLGKRFHFDKAHGTITRIDNNVPQMKAPKKKTTTAAAPGVLHLVLIGKWFDLIASGIKTEEYRQISPYWSKRFKDFEKKFNTVCFHRGYTNVTLSFRNPELKKGYGKVRWGAPVNDKVFIIKFNKQDKI